MRIGFDFDGTITKNPFLFKKFIDIFRTAGIEIFIISGTAEVDRPRLLAELESYEIRIPNDCIILPPQYNDVLETSTWKRDQIDKLKIRAYFENRIETISVINDLCTTFRVL